MQLHPTVLAVMIATNVSGINFFILFTPEGQTVIERNLFGSRKKYKRNLFRFAFGPSPFGLSVTNRQTLRARQLYITPGDVQIQPRIISTNVFPGHNITALKKCRISGEPRPGLAPAPNQTDPENPNMFSIPMNPQKPTKKAIVLIGLPSVRIILERQLMTSVPGDDCLLPGGSFPDWIVSCYGTIPAIQSFNLPLSC